MLFTSIEFWKEMVEKMKKIIIAPSPKEHTIIEIQSVKRES